MNKILNLLSGLFKPAEKLTPPIPLKTDYKPISELPQLTSDDLIKMFEDDVLQYAGQTENGGNTNRGDYIDMFNRSIGIPMGSAYCLSAIQHTRRFLEKKLDGVFDLPYVAGTQVFWTQTDKKYKFKEPKRGRLAVFKSALDSSKGHIGVCLSDQIGSTFNTFEFNTSGNGSRDGRWQMRKTRSMVNNGSLILLGFIDYEQSFSLKNQSQNSLKLS